MPDIAPGDIDRFVSDGFLRLEAAFPAGLAADGREILWRDLPGDPDDRSTWTNPVVRLGGYHDAPFVRAANTPRLHAAYAALAGADRWVPPAGLGTFPVRFPSPDDPGDTGWHADAGFSAPDGSMRLNLHSSGRALLMLFLFSDIGPDDAPTRIWRGSHLLVPRELEGAGDDGLTFVELAARLPPPDGAEIVEATGQAGDVFLCHPFLIHAAQRHRGVEPRFLAQPPLVAAAPLRLERPDGGYSAVETAIRRGLRVESAPPT